MSQNKKNPVTDVRKVDIYIEYVKSTLLDLMAIPSPAGFTDEGLPVGVELLGTPFSEPSLLSLAYSYDETVELLE